MLQNDFEGAVKVDVASENLLATGLVREICAGYMQLIRKWAANNEIDPPSVWNKANHLIILGSGSPVALVKSSYNSSKITNFQAGVVGLQTWLMGLKLPEECFNESKSTVRAIARELNSNRVTVGGTPKQGKRELYKHLCSVIKNLAPNVTQDRTLIQAVSGEDRDWSMRLALTSGKTLMTKKSPVVNTSGHEYSAEESEAHVIISSYALHCALCRAVELLANHKPATVEFEIPGHFFFAAQVGVKWAENKTCYALDSASGTVVDSALESLLTLAYRDKIDWSKWEEPSEAQARLTERYYIPYNTQWSHARHTALPPILQLHLLLSPAFSLPSPLFSALFLSFPLFSFFPCPLFSVLFRSFLLSEYQVWSSKSRWLKIYCHIKIERHYQEHHKEQDYVVFWVTWEK